MSDNLPERAAIVANKHLVQLDIEQMYRFATGYARANLFSGSKFGVDATPEDLFVRISAGQAIGLDPYTSVSEFYFVKGKLVMSTNLQLALAKASGKYDYRVEWGDSLQEIGINELPPGLTKQEAASWPTPKWCRITVYAMPAFEKIGESLFTLIDSWRAGLLSPSRNGEPSNHLKYPKNMLFNRAGSNAVAFYMPDATMIRAYDHGEIEGDVWSETRGPSTVTAEVVTDADQEREQDRELTPEEHARNRAIQEEEIQDADVEEAEPKHGRYDGMDSPRGEVSPMTGRVSDDVEEETAEEHYERTCTGNAGDTSAQGEMRPGESTAEAMNRMVREETAAEAVERGVETGWSGGFKVEDRGTFDPASEPAPPVVQPPTWATGEPEPQPTVEVAPHEPTISPGRRGLLMALAGRAGLTDKRRHEIVTEITGQPHSDRIPDRLFQQVLDRLNDEVQLAEQEVEAVGQSADEAPA